MDEDALHADLGRFADRRRPEVVRQDQLGVRVLRRRGGVEEIERGRGVAAEEVVVDDPSDEVDGLVIAPARLPTEAFTPYLERVPIVVAGRHETFAGLSSVACDDEDGGRELARHLLGLGHRRIAVVLVDSDYSLRYHSRAAAMIAAIREAGGFAVVLSSPTDLESGSVVGSALDTVDVTAIMCPTDAAALDVLEVLRIRGGDDPSSYSVTGYDGYGPLAAPFLGLTTFHIPQEEVGRTAINLLLDQLEGTTDHDRFVSLRGFVVPGRTARPIGAE